MTKGLEALKHEIANDTNGITFQEIYELNLSQGRVLMFQVPPAPRGIPVSWKGHYYGRNGESLVPLSLSELELIRGQLTNPDWSAVICPDASVSDLDPEAVLIARKKFLDRHPRYVKDASVWTMETFLDKAKLARNGKLTRTAILLLGKPESVHHLSPHPGQITWKLDADEQAYEHFGPPFLLTVEDVFQRIRNIKFRIQPFNRIIPIELTKYDPKIILEALNNCIAHQNYERNARILLTEKADRLIFQNIGDFYDGCVEDYVLRERTPERYRNPFLAQAMVSLNMIDTMGMGIRRIFLEQRRRYFPLPEYDLSDGEHVCMTIYGKLIDENYSRILIEQEDLSLEEVLALDRIQKKQSISREEFLRLKSKKMVEGRYPRIFVAAHIAQATERKVDYTRRRGFDKQAYKDWVIKHLQYHGEASPRDIQQLLVDRLSDLLSDEQKKNKIRALMYEMSAKDKTIINNGVRGNQARWRLRR